MMSNIRPNPPSRRLDAIEHYQQATFEKGDADRRKEIRKRHPGAIRVCPSCRAFSERKRWRYDAEVLSRLEAAGSQIERTPCPGCARLAGGRIDGYVELRGRTLAENAEEVRHLVDHVAKQALRDDPVHRIASFVALEDRIVLETTSAWLAETLGKAIARRFHGELRLRFTPGEDFVRVYWTET